MSDPIETAPAPPEKYAFCKLWHPSQPLQVSIPIPLAAGLSVEDASRLLTSVDNLLAAGWLPQEARLGEGEAAETAEAVVLWETVNRDYSITPCVDLYAADQKYRFLTVYLDTQQEREDFERVSGLKLASMTPYVGEGHIERGKNSRLDSLICKAPHTFRAAHVPNPKHNPNAVNPKEKGAKRKFSRWPDLAPATSPAAAPAKPTQAASAHPQAQKTGNKGWLDISQEQRIAATMEMTDFMALLKVKRWAEGLADKAEAQPYLAAVLLRAYQLFQLRLGDAPNEGAIKDIMDSATGGNFGELNAGQLRDLGRVAQNRKTFLTPQS